MASTEEIAQFDGTGDYAMWKACLRAYALVKRLRNHFLGRCKQKYGAVNTPPPINNFWKNTTTSRPRCTASSCNTR
jgi:hypothetical protein